MCQLGGWKNLGYINNNLHLVRKYARIFVRGHNLFLEANSFPRATLLGTDDKYPNIFSRQMEAIVFIYPLNIFTTRAVLKIMVYHLDIPQF